MLISSVVHVHVADFSKSVPNFYVINLHTLTQESVSISFLPKVTSAADFIFKVT